MIKGLKIWTVNLVIACNNQVLPNFLLKPRVVYFGIAHVPKTLQCILTTSALIVMNSLILASAFSFPHLAIWLKVIVEFLSHN